MNATPFHLCGATFRLCILVSLLSALSPSLFASPPPELTVLRQQYDKVVAERVTASFDASLAELNTKYAAGIDRFIAENKAAGALKTVLALEAEKKRLADKLPLPTEDDEAAPEALKSLRTIYRAQLAKLEEARTANQIAILPAYSAKLAALEVTLTKADRVAEAAEVLAYREGLAQSGPLSPLSGAPPTPGTPSVQTAAKGIPSGASQGRTAKAPEMPSLKPSEAAAANRQLAEWCLNNKHDIDIEVDRHRTKIQNLQDIPKDKFELTRINYLASLPAGASSPFPWAALRASPKIEFIYLGFGDTNADVTMDDLAHLGALKDLKNLQLGGKINWADFDAKKLPILPALKVLSFPKATESVEIAVLKEKFPSLGSITFAFKEIEAQAFEQLSAWSGLWELRLDGSSAHLTSAHITALAKLPALHVLILYPFTNAIDPSVKTLARIDSINLNYDCPIETFQAICSMPGLTTLQVTNNKKLTDSDLAAISGLSKLKELNLWIMPELTDACATHITTLKALASLSLSGLSVTDSILPELAKMKKLKKLSVKNTQITDAGVAAFKKQRPDVELIR